MKTWTWFDYGMLGNVMIGVFALCAVISVAFFESFWLGLFLALTPVIPLFIGWTSIRIFKWITHVKK